MTGNTGNWFSGSSGGSSGSTGTPAPSAPVQVIDSSNQPGWGAVAVPGRATVTYKESGSGAVITTQVPTRDLRTTIQTQQGGAVVTSQIPPGATIPQGAVVVSNPLAAITAPSPAQTPQDIAKISYLQQAAKDQASFSSLSGLTLQGRPVSEFVSLETRPTNTSASISANIFGGEQNRPPAKLPVIERTPLDASLFPANQSPREKYISSWWESKPLTEKVVIGGNTILSNLISRPVDFILSKGNPPAFSTLAYDTLSRQAELENKYGYVKGFGMSLISNEGFQIVGGGLAAGAGLGVISTRSAILAKGIGIGMVGLGAYDISKKVSSGDIKGAAVETGLFALSYPFASVGYEAGANLGSKIPYTIGIRKPVGVLVEMGETPIVERSPLGKPSGNIREWPTTTEPFKANLYQARFVQLNGRVVPDTSSYFAYREPPGQTYSMFRGMPKPEPVATSLEIVGGRIVGTDVKSPFGEPLIKNIPEPQLLVGTTRTRMLEIKMPEIFQGTRLDFSYKVPETVAQTYLEVPKESVPQFLKAATGEIKYIKTPEGSYMVVSGAKALTPSSGLSPDFNIFNRKLIEGVVEFPTGQSSQAQSFLDRISSIFPRIEMKETLRPAQYIETTVTDRLKLEARFSDIDTTAKDWSEPRKPMAPMDTMSITQSDITGQNIFEGRTEVTGTAGFNKLIAPIEKPMIRMDLFKSPSEPGEFKSMFDERQVESSSYVKNIFKDSTVKISPIISRESTKTTTMREFKPLVSVESSPKLQIQSIKESQQKRQLAVIDRDIFDRMKGIKDLFNAPPTNKREGIFSEREIVDESIADRGNERISPGFPIFISNPNFNIRNTTTPNITPIISSLIFPSENIQPFTPPTPSPEITPTPSLFSSPSTFPAPSSSILPTPTSSTRSRGGGDGGGELRIKIESPELNFSYGDLWIPKKRKVARSFYGFIESAKIATPKQTLTQTSFRKLNKPKIRRFKEPNTSNELNVFSSSKFKSPRKLRL